MRTNQAKFVFMTPKAILLPRAPMLQSHCRLAIPKASVNSALPWSLIEGQFIISYPARVEGEWKRVSHYFPDPTHTLTDFEVLVVGLVKFVCAACNQMRKTSLADHQTCHQLLQAWLPTQVTNRCKPLETNICRKCMDVSKWGRSMPDF